jgi:hypothetical protein
MSLLRSVSKFVCLSAAFLLSASLANAQATRTWVSGVGDDANPCSRTAPCKTFAGAISKTASGGEINVMDPGGYGGVTITKSISIVNDGVGSAGVLVAGTNAIIVNAPAGSQVVLRGLDIEGLGSGLNGIRVLAVGSLTVENCTINNFTQKGIDFEPNISAQLSVKNTVIRNNRGASAGGILIKPLLGAIALATIDNVSLERNQFGLRVEDKSRVSIRDSVVHGNTAEGIVAFIAAVQTDIAVITTTVVNNDVVGIKAEGNVAFIRVTGSTITGNATGITQAAGGSIFSAGNNMLNGNLSGNGIFTLPALGLQ